MIGLTDADRANIAAAWVGCAFGNAGARAIQEAAENTYRAGIAAGLERTKHVARLAIAYDKAIQACANDPDAMSSHCTTEGDTLDDLYANWIDAARALLNAPAAP
jgi:multimeric flavodoxin WrbA